MPAKKIGSAPQLNTLHANVSWKHNFEALPEERGNYYIAVIGYSQRVGPDTNMMELGFRHQINPVTLINAGAGAGIGEDSPDFRFTIGFQHAFLGKFMQPCSLFLINSLKNL